MGITHNGQSHIPLPCRDVWNCQFPAEAFQIWIGRGEIGTFQLVECGFMLWGVPAPTAIAFMMMGLLEISRCLTRFKIKAGANVTVQSDQVVVMKRAPILPFGDTDGFAKHLAAIAGIPTMVHGFRQLAGGDVVFEGAGEKAAFFQTARLIMASAFMNNVSALRAIWERRPCDFVAVVTKRQGRPAAGHPAPPGAPATGPPSFVKNVW